MPVTGMMGAVAAMARPAPASLVFSGAGFGSGEVLSRINSTTSPSTKLLTISIWANIDTIGANDFFYMLWSSDDNANLATFETSTTVNRNSSVNGGDTVMDSIQYFPNYSTLEFAETVEDDSISFDVWYHYVYRFDINNGTAANRVRFYRNNVGKTSAASGATQTAPSTSVTLDYFNNGQYLNIGSEEYGKGKVAFIDVVDGQSLAPSEFAFTHNGVWTAKRYQGNYGTYGFRLDGTHRSNGCGDVSGNNMHFTPTNWSVASNLDYTNLPPYVF